MTEPQIVTPQEANDWKLSRPNGVNRIDAERLFQTVATEPERTRAAVVTALRYLSVRFWQDPGLGAGNIDAYIESIENGADL